MDSLNSNLEFFSMIIFIIFIFFYHSYSCFIFTMSFQYFTAIICWTPIFQKIQFKLCIAFKGYFNYYLEFLLYVFQFKYQFLKSDLEFSSTSDYHLFNFDFSRRQFVNHILFKNFRIFIHFYLSWFSNAFINLINHPLHLFKDFFSKAK